MGEDEANLNRLWREKRGEIEPEDLTDNLIVQLGVVTEDLNRRWYQYNTGHAIKHVQKRIQHPVNNGWRRRSTAWSNRKARCSKPNSCCHGRSSEQAAAGKAHGAAAAQYVDRQCAIRGACRSSPARQMGRAHAEMPIRSTNICCVPRKRNSGAASRTARRPGCLASSRPDRDWRRSASSVSCEVSNTRPRPASSGAPASPRPGNGNGGSKTAPRGRWSTITPREQQVLAALKLGLRTS